LHTNIGVWWFNPVYLVGLIISIFRVEEVLCLICISYSCLFTYPCFKLFIHIEPFKKTGKIISLTLIISSFLLLLTFYNRLYTLGTFSLLLILFITYQFILKVTLLHRFYFTYFILMTPFIIVNDLLTGTGMDSPAVLYDDTQNMGIRLLCIPGEDVFYGLCLILINVGLFEYFDKILTKKIIYSVIDFYSL
jgi:lycopene cyclase domain-containing protein